MAPIKHWCISPTSQIEQKPTCCTRQCFIHLLSLCPQGSPVWAAIKSHPLSVTFLTNAKKRLCDQDPHMNVIHLCCIHGLCIDTRDVIWIQIHYLNMKQLSVASKYVQRYLFCFFSPNQVVPFIFRVTTKIWTHRCRTPMKSVQW